MFLDSDDVLPPGAAAALLAAAERHGAQVASGLCVRRELPSGREVPWQPELYAKARLVARPELRTRLVHDTLCVNKLYRTDFLREHGIRFPEGRFVYEDFVFTARVLAAGPRHRARPGHRVRVARAARRRQALHLPGPLRDHQLAGPHGGPPPVRGDPAGRVRARRQAAGAGGPRQVHRPRAAHVRPRTDRARRGVPARVVGAHARVPGDVRRRRPRRRARPGPRHRARRPRLGTAARPAAAEAGGGAPGTPRPAVPEGGRRHARLGR